MKKTCHKKKTNVQMVTLCSEAASGGVLLKKGVLRNFVKLTGKHLCHFSLKRDFSGTGVFL